MKKYILVVSIAIFAIMLTLICTKHSNAEEVANEQEASEKTTEHAVYETTLRIGMEDISESIQEVASTIQETYAEDDSTSVPESESDIAVETYSETVEEETDFSGFNRSIPNQFKDDDILNELRARLKDLNIEWWYPYAVAQMYQESRMNPFVENKNGLDKGLFQYRITFWEAVCREHGYTEASIFDWHVQMDIYVRDTARRLKSGCSINETVSRHNTSDYGTYNDEYVRQVMQWVY